MKQTIRPRGLTLNRDEMAAEHGELALCGGVEVHDGALRPSLIEGTMLAGGAPLTGSAQQQMSGDTFMNLTGVGKLLYVHKTADYTYYICKLGSQLLYAKENDSSWSVTTISGFTSSSIHSVTAVGNTLVVATGTGLHYFLCKKTGDDFAYNYLGQQPPFVEITFNLDYLKNKPVEKRDGSIIHLKTRTNGEQYEVVLPEDTSLIDSETDSKEVDVGGNKVEFPFYTVNPKASASITEQVMAKVNERIDKVLDEGLFYAPFLVRYCYRLFDGSMVMHSPPVLMMPALYHSVLTSITKFYSKELNPIVDGHLISDKWAGQDFEGSFNFKVFLIRSQLQVMHVLNSAELADWKDIVKSVDIFITPQFSRIDTSRKIDRIGIFYSDTNYSLMDGGEKSIKELFEDSYTGPSSDQFHTDLGGFELPEVPEEEYFSRIRNASSFYKVLSVPVEDVGKLVGNLTVDPGVIKNIAVQEQMTDDYKTHNRLLPATDEGLGMYVYNHRLNVYNIKEKLFKGFPLNVLFPYVGTESVSSGEIIAGGEVGSGTSSGGGTTSTGEESITDVYVYLHASNGIHKLTAVGGKTLQWLLANGYCFYPDARAVHMVFFAGQIGLVRSLEDHAFLNGSVSFMPTTQSSEEVSIPDDLDTVPITNKIYTSRADNPFYFPNLPGESGVNTVGNGNVIALAAVTRALSQGQVGDHDLAAFCTDGIWVLKVSSTGTYSQAHNISRDVCSNKRSVCQLDQSVVFATRRSLARFVESDGIPFSDVLDGPIPQWNTLLPSLCAMFSAADGDSADVLKQKEIIRRLLNFSTPAVEVFQKGTVLYDYTSSRILVFPADTAATRVALVFSIRDKAWSTMPLPLFDNDAESIVSAIPGYPSPYIQFGNGSVACLDKPFDNALSTVYPGIVITRTLTFSDTMDVMRGFRQLTSCVTMPMLYFFGSNDQLSWQPIGNTQRAFHNYMPGHPFRFFRIAIVLNMKKGERYQELALEIVNKYAKL